MIPFSKRYVKKKPTTVTVPVDPPPATGSNKYFSGYAVKLEPWQVVDSLGDPKVSNLTEVKNELINTDALIAIKWVIDWGDIDQGGTGTSTWDMRIINYLVKMLYDIRQTTGKKKYLLLAMPFKGTISNVLPPDMRTTGGYTPGKGGYTVYKYAWPYGSGASSSNYYAALFDTAVLNRFNTFCQKLANHVVPNTDGSTLDEGDYLYMISSLESATQPIYDSAFPGYSLVNHEDGCLEMVKRMKNNFPNTMVSICLNYSRPFCDRTFPKLGALKIGVNTPNMNFSEGLVLVGTPNTTQGVLRYFMDEAYASSIVLSPEIQGDDYYATTGIDARRIAKAAAAENPPNWAAVDAAYDFPSYITLHRRCRDDLNAHIIIAQRTYPFWPIGGGTYSESFATVNGTVSHNFPGTRPSFLSFLQNNAEVKNDVANGFRIRPTNWL